MWGKRGGRLGNHQKGPCFEYLYLIGKYSVHYSNIPFNYLLPSFLSLNVIVKVLLVTDHSYNRAIGIEYLRDESGASYYVVDDTKSTGATVTQASPFFRLAYVR